MNKVLINGKKEEETLKTLQFEEVKADDVEFVFDGSFSMSFGHITNFRSTCGRFLKRIYSEIGLMGNKKKSRLVEFAIFDDVEFGRTNEDYEIPVYNSLEKCVESYNVTESFKKDKLIEQGYRVVLVPTIVKTPTNHNDNRSKTADSPNAR